MVLKFMIKFIFCSPKVVMEVFGSMCFVGRGAFLELLREQDVESAKGGMWAISMPLWGDFLLKNCRIVIAPCKPSTLVPDPDMDGAIHHWDRGLVQGLYF